jgi:hypothetical protein
MILHPTDLHQYCAATLACLQLLLRLLHQTLAAAVRTQQCSVTTAAIAVESVVLSVSSGCSMKSIVATLADVSCIA